jgi:hypothetical protein
MIYTNPLLGFIRTLLLFLTGRVRFYKQDVGSSIVMEDGKEFTIFRRVIIKDFYHKEQTPEALFIVCFTPVMDIAKNIRLSKIMLLIFMGFKGFRSKYWCVNEETGMCQGIYEWDKREDAERYSTSIAVTNMTKRSVPGSISFEILPNTEQYRTWQIFDKPDRKEQFTRKYKL